MAVNSDKPERWKADISKSVDLYNNWFMEFAPKAYRETRIETTKKVELAMRLTHNLTDISVKVLKDNPSVLPILRMSTAPPIARDRLIGLAGISPNIVKAMELEERIPPRMGSGAIKAELGKIGEVIMRMVDRDIFQWLGKDTIPKQEEVLRAATIIADRLCGATADPIIRNAQERRQLKAIGEWLKKRGYEWLKPSEIGDFKKMKSNTYTFRLNVPVSLKRGGKEIKIPIDVAVMPRRVKMGRMPLLIEAKSAGDFTNTNKRRKEEAAKISQLKSNYGEDVRFILFLCGYFDSGYLGYEAAEGIDWVWEHRIDDLEKFGV